MKSPLTNILGSDDDGVLFLDATNISETDTRNAQCAGLILTPHTGSRFSSHFCITSLLLVFSAGIASVGGSLMRGTVLSHSEGPRRNEKSTFWNVTTSPDPISRSLLYEHNTTTDGDELVIMS
ncbi:hypothetical protein BC827DRAFT_1173869 [Russula dissimulans]|nr:hypothetical protein BC827DRAFT_1173869 [Russula dissimulans]